MAKQHTTRDLANLTPEDLAHYVGRKLAHNTYVESDHDGSIGVRFHSTRILTFHPEGTFTVNTGGYRTVTTKQRLNALLPKGYRIHSERYAWKITTPEGVFDFVDGDTWKGDSLSSWGANSTEQASTCRTEAEVVDRVLSGMFGYRYEEWVERVKAAG